jgi:hypothetical protein
LPVRSIQSFNSVGLLKQAATMAKDSDLSLSALLQDKLDPRVISQSITAYLGSRSNREKRLALQALQLEFQSRLAAEPRAAAVVLRVIESLLADLA